MKSIQIGLLKKIAKIFSVIIFLVFIFIFILLNFVLTPDRITPPLVKAINKNLEAELNIDKLELTFFKTFPNFSLIAKKGEIINPIPDTISPKKQDTLVSFDQCRISINPMALIKRKINITHLNFIHPKIYTYVDPDGNLNWNVLKDQDSLKPADNNKKEYDIRINIENILIENGYLLYEDALTNLFAGLNKLDLKLNAKYHQKSIKLKLDGSADYTKFWMYGDTIINDLELKFNTRLDYDRIQKKIDVKQSEITLNDLELLTEGYLVESDQNKAVSMDLDVIFKNNSLINLVKLFPERFVDTDSPVKTKGKMTMTAKLKGDYGKDLYPTINAEIVIDKGMINFRKMKHKIDLINGSIDFFIDPAKKLPSFINFNDLQIKAHKTKFDFNGEVARLLENFHFSGIFNGNINMTSLYHTLPFREGIQMNGDITTNLMVSFYKNDILLTDYGKVFAQGNIDLDDLFFESLKDSILLATDRSRFHFTQKTKDDPNRSFRKNAVKGTADISNFKLINQSALKLKTDHFYLNFESSPSVDTTIVTTITSNIDIKNSFLQKGDSIQAVIKNAKGDLNLFPSKNNMSNGVFNTHLEIDSVGAKNKYNYFYILSGQYDLQIHKTIDKKWLSEGSLSFNSFEGFSTSLPLVFKMPSTKISIDQNKIVFNGSLINLGVSDYVISGELNNFANYFFKKDTLIGDFIIRSNLTDTNQLIRAINIGAENLKNTTSVEIDENEKVESASVFVVPAKVDLNFQCDLERVIFGNLNLSNVKGSLEIKDQLVKIKNIRGGIDDAMIQTTATYSAKSIDKASVDFNFNLSGIDLHKLNEVIPVLDTLVPMTRSFQGVIDFRMKGHSGVNHDLGINSTSLNAIALLKGKNIVILDSEQFREIAKKLFFKDKEDNVLESITIPIQINNQKVEFLPTEIQVDRYRTAVGGEHNFDLKYLYHISILKTPIPLVKLGLDIKGQGSSYEVDLTNARYKKMFAKSKRKRKKADQDLIRRKEIILNELDN